MTPHLDVFPVHREFLLWVLATYLHNLLIALLEDFLVIPADGYHRFQRERAAALAWGLGDGEGFVGPVVTVGSFIGIFEDADVGQCLVDVEQLVVIGARLDGIGCLQEVFLAELIFITRTVEDT